MSEAERVEPFWLDLNDILTVHERQLSEHGGGSDIRDRNLLESALSRPINSWHYGDPDAAALAADYAFGIARNHAFVDGNKRTAWVAARLFLRMNGRQLKFVQEDAIRMVLALAAGNLAENELADWFRQRIVAD